MTSQKEPDCNVEAARTAESEDPAYAAWLWTVRVTGGLVSPLVYVEDSSSPPQIMVTLSSKCDAEALCEQHNADVRALVDQWIAMSGGETMERHRKDLEMIQRFIEYTEGDDRDQTFEVEFPVMVDGCRTWRARVRDRKSSYEGRANSMELAVYHAACALTDELVRRRGEASDEVQRLDEIRDDWKRE